VAAGKIEVDAALRAIRVARQRADQVHALLREVGDVDPKLALSLRFKRTKRRFEASPPDDAGGAPAAASASNPSLALAAGLSASAPSAPASAPAPQPSIRAAVPGTK
jgi:hypothetical protein